MLSCDDLNVPVPASAGDSPAADALRVGSRVVRPVRLSQRPAGVQRGPVAHGVRGARSRQDVRVAGQHAEARLHHTSSSQRGSRLQGVLHSRLAPVAATVAHLRCYLVAYLRH